MEIIREYTAEEFDAREPLILINIRKAFEDETKSVYEAVRGCWVINPDRARKYNLVLAQRHGIVVGAFRPTDWIPSTKTNFPWHNGDESRWGFVGEPVRF